MPRKIERPREAPEPPFCTAGARALLLTRPLLLLLLLLAFLLGVLFPEPGHARLRFSSGPVHRVCFAPPFCSVVSSTILQDLRLSKEQRYVDPPLALFIFLRSLGCFCSFRISPSSRRGMHSQIQLAGINYKPLYCDEICRLA